MPQVWPLKKKRKKKTQKTKQTKKTTQISIAMIIIIIIMTEIDMEGMKQSGSKVVSDSSKAKRDE